MKRIKKVMLINPPNIMPRDSIRRIATPMGLLYIAAVLRDRGYDVKIFDAALEGYYNTQKITDSYIAYGSSLPDIEQAILDYSPDIVGVSCLFMARESKFTEICKLVRKILPNAKLIAGGIHAALFFGKFLNSVLVDYVILSEGDFRLADLLDYLNGVRDLSSLDGIAFKDGDKIQILPVQTKIMNLDSIPLPARDLVDMKKYIDICTPFAPFPKKARVAQILTTRGCPQNCCFCSAVNFWGRRFRIRSVDNVMMEIDELVTKYGIEEIQFVDDNMTVDKKRAIEIFKRMVPYNLSWCTPNGLSTITLDDKMIDLMAESGAYQLSLGVESGSKYVLDKIIDKKINLDKIAPLIERAHKNNISVHTMFIIGFPGETKEQIQETFDFAGKIEPDSVSFFVANPLPGSRLHKDCLKKGYITEETTPFFDFKAAAINIPEDSPDYNYSPEELVSLAEKHTVEFNERYRKKHPEQWREKFKLFLERHPHDADLILGRVT